MIRDEDRVPLNVIEECVQREEQMLEILVPIVASSNDFWAVDNGHWWLQLHIVMILGRMSGEEAGMLLVDFIYNMSREEDGNVQDWFAGYWPALTQNKPTSVVEKLRNFCENKQKPYYMRSNLSDAIIAYAHRQGENDLEQALDWMAQQVTDEEEDWDYRLNTANTLLDFPRERFRVLLHNLAERQNGIGVSFDKKDINFAFLKKIDQPGWKRFNNPWSFYDKTEIERRQRRWKAEARYVEEPIDEPNEFLEDSRKSYEHQPYHRETSKVGRNDPCPCGSGKKYKKCCLH